MKTSTHPEEIIGKTMKVVESTNPDEIGIEGKIIDETKNTIVVETKKGEKKLMKNHITIMINNQKISGKNLAKRPEERIK